MRDFSGEDRNLVDKVVYINRVAKVVKGGRRFSFSALVVVGDQSGRVGFALGKAKEVPEAIRKGIEKAKATMIKVPLVNGTIPYEINGRAGAGKVMLRPASQGTGVIAGGPVRAVLEAAGVENVLTKCLGTNNPNNVIHATFEALSSLKDPAEFARKRGKAIDALPYQQPG